MTRERTHQPTTGAGGSDGSDGSDVIVGVDIGGTSTRVVAFDVEGAPLVTATSRTPIGAEAVIEHTSAEIGRVVAETGRRVRAIGVGIPGRIDDEGNVTMAINLGISEATPVRRTLADRFGVPVVVANDVNTAALGTFVALGCSDTTSLAYIGLGTGVAAGVIVDGALLRGATGTVGEIGHVPVPGCDIPCRCGQTGCLEAVIAGPAIEAEMVSAGLHGTVVDLWAAADAGAPSAIALRDGFLNALAWAVATVVMAYDPHIVAIGGGVTAVGQPLIDAVTRRLRARERHSFLLTDIAPSERVRLAPTNIELGARGAARLAHTLPQVCR